MQTNVQNSHNHTSNLHKEVELKSSIKKVSLQYVPFQSVVTTSVSEGSGKSNIATEVTCYCSAKVSHTFTNSQSLFHNDAQRTIQRAIATVYPLAKQIDSKPSSMVTKSLSDTSSVFHNPALETHVKKYLYKNITKKSLRTALIPDTTCSMSSTNLQNTNTNLLEHDLSASTNLNTCEEKTDLNKTSHKQQREPTEGMPYVNVNSFKAQPELNNISKSQNLFETYKKISVGCSINSTTNKINFANARTSTNMALKTPSQLETLQAEGKILNSPITYQCKSAYNNLNNEKLIAGSTPTAKIFSNELSKVLLSQKLTYCQNSSKQLLETTNNNRLVLDAKSFSTALISEGVVLKSNPPVKRLTSNSVSNIFQGVQNDLSASNLKLNSKNELQSYHFPAVSMQQAGLSSTVTTSLGIKLAESKQQQSNQVTSDNSKTLVIQVPKYNSINSLNASGKVQVYINGKLYLLPAFIDNGMLHMLPSKAIQTNPTTSSLETTVSNTPTTILSTSVSSSLTSSTPSSGNVLNQVDMPSVVSLSKAENENKPVIVHDKVINFNTSNATFVNPTPRTIKTCNTFKQTVQINTRAKFESFISPTTIDLKIRGNDIRHQCNSFSNEKQKDETVSNSLLGDKPTSNLSPVVKILRDSENSKKNLEVLTKSKNLFPIRETGSARSNGIQPYKREDIILYELKCPISNNAKEINIESLFSNSLLTNDKNTSSRTTYDKVQTIKRTSRSLSPWNITTITDTFHSTDILSKTLPCIGNNVVANKIGIIRTDDKEDQKLEINDLEFTSKRFLIKKSNKNKIKKKTFTVKNKIKLSEFTAQNVDCLQDSIMNTLSTGQLKRATPNLRPGSIMANRTPASKEEISRVYFALDRLCKNRSYWGNEFILQKVIDHLFALKNMLEKEKDKQKLYIDENLEKWKKDAQKMETKKKILTPAEKLLQKFSLKVNANSSEKTIKDSVLCMRETNLQPNKVDDKKKSFTEILKEQTKKREIKKNIKSNSTFPKKYGAKRQNKETVETSDLKKKKRPSEIDQLTDTHWNESWLKDDEKDDFIVDPELPTTREVRKLHYAMSKFAEMEQKRTMKDDENTLAANQPIPVQGLSPMKEQKLLHAMSQLAKVEPKKNVYSTTSISTRKLGSTDNNNKLMNKRNPHKKITSQGKKLESLNAARQHALKAKQTAIKRHVAQTEQAHFESCEPTVKVQKLHLSRPSSASSSSQGKLHKKEYILVPKYNGFKDFTPVVVESRTRHQASADDREKLQKPHFPLMVVETIGNVTKQVVIEDGEDKDKKVLETQKLIENDIEKSIKKKPSLVYSRTSAGETVLHKAARLGQVDMTELSLQDGRTNVNACDNAGWTALHEACIHGKTDVARVLLKYGADPNCFSDTGSRPLHDAVEKNHIECARLLLSYGGDLGIASYTGALPIDLASSQVLRSFLSDVSSDQKFKVNDGVEKPWQFQGSSRCLDTSDCSGIFDNIPTDDRNVNQVEFIMTSREIPQSFYLPYENDVGITLGYRNYFILSDILERLGMARSTFKKHHKVTILRMKYTEFKEHLKNNPLNDVSHSISQSLSTKNDYVELVHIGAYSLKKSLNAKTIKLKNSI